MERDNNWQMPRYTDGTFVTAGDSIRYKQAPGGILAPSGNWTTGTAVPSNRFGYPSLVLEAANGYRYNLVSHIIERVN